MSARDDARALERAYRSGDPTALPRLAVLYARLGIPAWLPPELGGLHGETVYLGPERVPLYLCYVPAGPCVLGDGLRRRDAVCPAGFHLALHPVTNEQWFAGGGEPREEPHAGADLPRTMVTWDEARDWCARNGLRLPGEDEWEYAARGSDGRTYPWGNESPTPERAVFDRPWQDGPRPVGPRERPAGASPFGLLDMAGTVWEWCATPWSRDFGVWAGADPTPATDRPNSPPSVAGAGTTRRRTAARSAGSGTSRATGTRGSASDPEGDSDPTPATEARPCASTVAGAGPPRRRSAARPTGAGPIRATGSRAWASAPEGESGYDGASLRVLRGGSWYDSAAYCRAAYRNGSVPGCRSGWLGFRPARH